MTQGWSHNRSNDRRRDYLTLYAAAVALFLLNDLWWMAIESGVVFYVLDWVFRLVLIMAALVYVRVRSIPFRRFFADVYIREDPPKGSANERFRRTRFWRIVLYSLGVTLVSTAIGQTVWPFLAFRLPTPTPVVLPTLTGPLRLVDLTVGLALVSLTEEVVFRALAVRVLLRRGSSVGPAVSETPGGAGARHGADAHRAPGVSWRVVVVSSIVFGLIHWSNGLHAVINAALVGVVPMVALMKTGSLWPALVAHYLGNLVAFLGIVPEAWYRFLM